MASKTAVARALGILSTSFGGDVTSETLAVYHDAFSDLTDDQLGAAVRVVLREHEGRFIPPPATIRNAIGANAQPVIDDGEILERIRSLARFNPALGMRYPTASEVRDALGDGIADAYISAGGARLFANSETTRDIARRELRSALAWVARTRGTDALELPAPPERKALPTSVTFGTLATPALASEPRRLSPGEFRHAG